MDMTPVFILLTRYVGQRRRRVTAQAQESKAEMPAITRETLSVSEITLSKLFGRQDREIQRFNEENRRLSDLTVRQQMTGQFPHRGPATSVRGDPIVPGAG